MLLGTFLVTITFATIARNLHCYPIDEHDSTQNIHIETSPNNTKRNDAFLSNQNATRRDEDEEKSTDKEKQESEEFRTEQLKTAAVELLGATAAVLGVTNPVTAATIVVGTIGLSKMFQDFESKSKDIWDALEDRIDIKIG